MTTREKIEALRARGVTVCAPETLEIGDEVAPEQIHGPDTVLHGGTKLFGKNLLILPGCRIGYEEPATLEDCALGNRVTLQGGYYAKSVFLDGAVMGKGAHIRAGTLLEEEANGAHTVGLKQTILLPFVTLGSLINFCDVLMAGGSSRRDHSEVGSSFIHFNFTPFGRNGDKATPSLIGDVPRGVMLRSPRIFLGGQGGLVGPLCIDYGTVLAAGCVYRKDHGPNELVVGEDLPARTLPLSPLRYSRVRAKVEKNLGYIGNLVALWHWYEKVRCPLAAGEAKLLQLWRRAQGTIASCISERITRLGQIAGYMEDSVRELEGSLQAKELADQQGFAASWPQLEQQLTGYPRQVQDNDAFKNFLAGWTLAAERSRGNYLDTVRGLDEVTVAAGTRWLQSLVTQTAKVPF